MVRLADGRSRSIPRSITDLATEPFEKAADSIEESLRISVRTLLPLAQYLTARSSSLEVIGDARAASQDANSLDPSHPGRIGAASIAASRLEEALPERQTAGRVHRRRHGQTDGGKGHRGAR